MVPLYSIPTSFFQLLFADYWRCCIWFHRPQSSQTHFSSCCCLGNCCESYSSPRVEKASTENNGCRCSKAATFFKDLRQAVEKELWMLARMCQLENKMVAVGEPSYRARRGCVERVRESLKNSLFARIELLESYAKISSMIEIEVEMDSDVLAAKAVSNAFLQLQESITEEIQQMMEIENLEERCRIQAEANDEVERLLNSQPVSVELV